MTTMATLNPSVEASDMLAAAIEQMDGIIANTRAASPVANSGHATCRTPTARRSLSALLDELRQAVENDADNVWDAIDPETRGYFLRLLHNGRVKANDTCLEPNDLHDKVRRLESDKENLSLQVSVLGEQIDAQNEKIRDLEVLLEQERLRARKIEEMMQQEIKLRSAMETQKLDLMSELSRLKFCVSTLEKEKFELEKKLFKAESEVSKSSRNIDHSSLALQRGRRTPTQEPTIEVEKMKKALESVMAANDEKDRKIDELRAAMFRYKKIQEKMLDKQRKLESDETNDTNEFHFNNRTGTPIAEIIKTSEKPPPGPRANQMTSTPLHGTKCEAPQPQLSPVSTGGRRSMSPRLRSPALNSTHGSEESVAAPVTSSPITTTVPQHVYSARIEHFGTVPRNYAPALATLASEGSSATLPGSSSAAVPRVKTTSFGKGFLSRARGSSRSTSAPNLAQTEVAADETPAHVISQENHKTKNSSKGFKRFLGRLKRSNSQTMEGEVVPADEFRRGGLRATAGSRLGWSQNFGAQKTDSMTVPFARWDSEKIMAWLHDLGLSAYISECKRWVRNGDQLLHATAEDLEKELGIKNPLHRKKLTLAIQAKSLEEDNFTNLDYHWVMRWLDDVGLPQYKDAFSDGRVDGRMLHYFSVDDLNHLRVTSLLHAVSLKQGIYVLRLHGFNPLCLKRRSAPDEPSHPPASDVALWTNHRVMEWLRSVDLSEYAPNLRGSGVHGALMVYEERFNAELLATLLSIPPNKTLLRRHLSMHFKELVGPEVMQLKRERESSAGYTQLTPILKVKIVRKSQFPLMRKRSKADMEDYLCPMDGQQTPKLVGSPTNDTTQQRNSPSLTHASNSTTSSTSTTTTSKVSPRLDRTGNTGERNWGHF